MLGSGSMSQPQVEAMVNVDHSVSATVSSSTLGSSSSKKSNQRAFDISDGATDSDVETAEMAATKAPTTPVSFAFNNFPVLIASSNFVFHCLFPHT